MLLRMYSLYDEGVKCYLKPFWSDHKQNAIRSFLQLVNDKSDVNNMVSNHPDQFTLFELGVFDSENGKFVPHDHNISLGNALEYVKKS